MNSVLLYIDFYTGSISNFEIRKDLLRLAFILQEYIKAIFPYYFNFIIPYYIVSSFNENRKYHMRF